MQLEQLVTSNRFRLSMWGLIAGFILSAMVILGGIYLIILGHDWAGSVLISVNLVGLAGVFVYGLNSRRGERQERHERLAEKAEMRPEYRRRRNQS